MIITSRKSGRMAAVFVAAAAGTALASAPVPFSDSFDSGYTDGQAVGGQNGWGASSSSVAITTAEYQSNPHSVAKPYLEMVSNTFSGAYASNVWMECWIKEAEHVPASAVVAVDTNNAVNLYMNTANQLVVCDTEAGGWRVCPTDVVGTASSAFSAGGWARVSVNVNYGTKRSAVFLNGHLVAWQVPLINTNTLTALSRLSIEGGRFGSSVYIDGVWVSTNWPQATSLTNDIDSDGMADAQEIHIYGNLTRHAGTRLVPSATYPAISNALALALAGESVAVSNGVWVESAVVSNGVTLTGTNLTGTATNWTMNGAVEVLSGGMVLVSGGQAVFANLTIDAGGTVAVSNATITVNGVTRSGTFTLGNGWQALVPRAVSFTETFESFGAGTMLGALGQWGWGASAGSVQVQAGGASGNGGVCSLAEKATNFVSAASGAKLWTDLYIQDNNTVPDTSLIQVDPNQTVTLCVGTNGYVLVYSGGNWLALSNDEAGGSVDGLWSSGWNRVSVFQDYGQHLAAIFLNGRLLKQQLPFINVNTNQMQWVGVEAGVKGDTRFDTLTVTNGVPVGLATGPSSDLDQDGLSDALEIQSAGNLQAYPRGSLYKIR